MRFVIRIYFRRYLCDLVVLLKALGQVLLDNLDDGNGLGNPIGFAGYQNCLVFFNSFEYLAYSSSYRVVLCDYDSLAKVGRG